MKCLPVIADEVHLNAVFPGVVKRTVIERVDIEICIELTVYPVQQVKIESGSYAVCIIVRGMQLLRVFLQVNADQQCPAITRNPCQVGQEYTRIIRLKITDAGSRIKI